MAIFHFANVEIIKSIILQKTIKILMKNSHSFLNTFRNKAVMSCTGLQAPFKLSAS
jgi:hypothetical protein